MPRKRFVQWEGRAWLLSELAAAYRLPAGTLSDRLRRFGDDPDGIARALATGLQSPRQAGLKGAARSSWRPPPAKA